MKIITPIMDFIEKICAILAIIIVICGIFSEIKKLSSPPEPIVSIWQEDFDKENAQRVNSIKR
ncbi:MAG: hypothetical protein HQK56_20530 [Deltaproteobacteria bacterium]|nr:hypothetical protein [Deltaproteobacteria bacterium]